MLNRQSSSSGITTMPWLVWLINYTADVCRGLLLCRAIILLQLTFLFTNLIRIMHPHKICYVTKDLNDKVARNCVIQYTTKMLNKCISYVGCGVIFLYCRESWHSWFLFRGTIYSTYYYFFARHQRGSTIMMSLKFFSTAHCWSDGYMHGDGNVESMLENEHCQKYRFPLCSCRIRPVFMTQRSNQKKLHLNRVNLVAES